MDPLQDTLEHMVEFYAAWAEHRRFFVAAIGDGNLSRLDLVQAMVRSDSACEAITFCGIVRLVKEVAERVRERQSLDPHVPSRCRRRPGRRETVANSTPLH